MTVEPVKKRIEWYTIHWTDPEKRGAAVLELLEHVSARHTDERFLLMTSASDEYSAHGRLVHFSLEALEVREY